LIACNNLFILLFLFIREEFNMANTYTKIHIQAVFSPKYRKALLLPEWSTDLHKYITGIIRNHDHKVLAINSMPDHIHIFFGMRPDESLSGLMQAVKKDSSKWINENGLCSHQFRWQEGFGGFSYSKSDVHSVIDYIHRQEEHHRKVNFLEEYRKYLEMYEIDYNDAYIFKEPE
jgi:putative transposase